MFESLSGLLVKAGLAKDVEEGQTTPTSVEPVKTSPAPNLGVSVGSSSDELANAILGNVKANLFDNSYFKLINSMETMKAAKLDEPSSAKGAAALMGASSITISSAIDEVINAIKGEQVAFENGDCKAMIDNVNALNAKASELESQIASLLEQVKAKSEEKAAVLDSATKANNDAQTIMATFNATVGKLISAHEAEKSKLITYLT